MVLPPLPHADPWPPDRRDSLVTRLLRCYCSYATLFFHHVCIPSAFAPCGAALPSSLVAPIGLAVPAPGKVDATVRQENEVLAETHPIAVWSPPPTATGVQVELWSPPPTATRAFDQMSYVSRCIYIFTAETGVRRNPHSTHDASERRLVSPHVFRPSPKSS